MAHLDLRLFVPEDIIPQVDEVDYGISPRFGVSVAAFGAFPGSAAG